MPTATLLLRLEGPVQGWGDAGAKWDYRPTTERPTKSGVIGLVGNALGRDYTDPIDDLAALCFAARADKPGHLEGDYRMAGGGTFPLDARTEILNPKLTPNPAGRINYGAPRGAKNMAWTESGREGTIRSMTFLADAGFLVSLTGDRGLLDEIAAAIHAPARILSLGRRANAPARPLFHQLLEGDRHHDWAGQQPLLDTATTPHPTAWVETTPGAGVISYEQPHTAAPGATKHPLFLATASTTPPQPTTATGLTQ